MSAVGADDDICLLIDPEGLARAEAALKRLSVQYLGWARADLVALEAHLAEFPADPSALQRMFRVAHDMKGQAATFDYLLVTELGNRLCRLIEEGGERDQLARLVAALRRTLDEELSGDGGEAGRELLDGL
jgi:hypothetical protein